PRHVSTVDRIAWGQCVDVDVTGPAPSAVAKKTLLMFATRLEADSLEAAAEHLRKHAQGMTPWTVERGVDVHEGRRVSVDNNRNRTVAVVAQQFSHLI